MFTKLSEFSNSLYFFFKHKYNFPLYLRRIFSEVDKKKFKSDILYLGQIQLAKDLLLPKTMKVMTTTHWTCKTYNCNIESI